VYQQTLTSTTGRTTTRHTPGGDVSENCSERRVPSALTTGAQWGRVGPLSASISDTASKPTGTPSWLMSVVAVLSPDSHWPSQQQQLHHLFAFGLASLFSQIRIDYSVHYLAPKRIFSTALAQAGTITCWSHLFVGNTNFYWWTTSQNMPSRCVVGRGAWLTSITLADHDRNDGLIILCRRHFHGVGDRCWWHLSASVNRW